MTKVQMTLSVKYRGRVVSSTTTIDIEPDELVRDSLVDLCVGTVGGLQEALRVQPPRLAWLKRLGEWLGELAADASQPEPDTAGSLP